MLILTLALLLDGIVGDPDWLWRRLPHPVVWFGKVISLFDKNRRNWKLENAGAAFGVQPGFVAGVLMLLALLVMCVFISQIVFMIRGRLPISGFVLETVLVAVLLAQRSLYDHGTTVVRALRQDGVAGGREAVSQIVGRDISRLNESGVCKATIESLAENFSDGVVAPALWYAVLGLPGILFYKAVNTADSMVGHHNEAYEYFGRPAAVLDDWMNWPAARLASLLTVVAVLTMQGKKAAQKVLYITRRDADSHRSPNAGWPETSFAVALGLSLGGPRSYADSRIDAAYLYPEGRKEARVGDIDRALALFLRCCLCLLAVCVLCWLVFC